MTQTQTAVTVQHVTREGRRTVDYYAAQTADGRAVATAHCVGRPDDTWSVKVGDRVLGLAKSRAVAVATLESIAAKVA